jgi:glycosyltransferase involved in cell wall biosynthesis
MPDRIATTHVLLPNQLVIYRRERSGIWQCRYKVADVWQRASTKQRDQKLAKQAARELMIEAEISKRANLPVVTSREDEPWIKRTGTKLFYALLRTEQGVQVPPHAGDFRLLDRAVIQSLLMLPERNRFMKGLYAWVGFRTQALPYMPQDRHAGRSHFGIFKLLRLALAGLMSFTTWPLRAVSVVGFVVSLCALLYGIFIVIKHLIFSSDVAGWPTIVTILLFFSGINLLSLGVVGEYVARIFEEVKARPIYLIQQQNGSAASGKGPKTTKNEG